MSLRPMKVGTVLVVIEAPVWRQRRSPPRSCCCSSPCASEPLTRSTTSSSTASALAAPRWYQVLRPFLPDGFDQMVLTNASAEAVSFRAWRTGTGQVLDVTIGLGTGGITETPDVATNTDEFGTWYASTSGVAGHD